MKSVRWWWSVASNSEITWVTNSLKINLAGATAKATHYLAKTTDFYSLRSMSAAKKSAKWTDRSGNARNGLFSDYNIDSSSAGSTYQIDLYHRVNYGVWLEIRWGGKWGIINRTVESEGPKFFATANAVMAKMFGGA